MTIKARLATAALIAFGTIGLFDQPASAEVRLGKNVRIGGHDVSHQTFNKQRRGRYYIYRTTPPKPGCRWVSHGDGSRTKVCHLKRKLR